MSKPKFPDCVVENFHQVAHPSKPILILSERLKYCLSILKFFGYFPFSFDKNGFIRFRFQSLQFLYSAIIFVLYIAGFIHLFLLGNTFDEVFKKGRRVFNKIDFAVFFSEAFLSCFIFLILLAESYVRHANFVSFWNNLQSLLKDIGDTDCGLKLRKETRKLLALFFIGIFSFVVIMSTGRSYDPDIRVTHVDLAFMGIWTMFGISYVYLFVYCNLMVYTLTLSFEQVEKLIKESFIIEDQNQENCIILSATKHAMNQETKIYFALDKFERTVQVLKQFQTSFGFKLLICVSKLCFSSFLSFRLNILVLKGKDAEESDIIFESAILHTGHLWGILLLVALCNHTQRMAGKASDCLASIKLYNLTQVVPQRIIPVVHVFLTQMRAYSYCITANGLINIDWTLFVSMAAVIISYSIILENFVSLPPGQNH